jgi:hypothetical protein
MQVCLSSLLLAVVVSNPSRDCYETANFAVYADSFEVARRVGESAEQHRANLTKRWFGAPAPAWSTRCRINVAAAERVGGVTEISFSRGKVAFQKVNVQGPLEQILKGSLPHELVHVLFAHHFGFQPPRWVDEGGAILSEHATQSSSHRHTLRRILDNHGQFPLRQLFCMKQYPSDIPCLYAQSHSVSDFLVAAKGHKTFLAFVNDGVAQDWDQAVRNCYGYENVEHLERAWLAWAVRPAKENPKSLVADE